MIDFIIGQSWFLWAWILVIGFPLLMLLLNEGVVQLDRRKKPLVVPVRILRNCVLPTLALFLLLVKVLQVGQETIFVRLIETILWIFIIYAVLTFINIVLFEQASPESWQSQVPKLFLDLSRFFFVLVGTALVLSSVWKADLGGLLAALGVGSLVIGLALQDSLGNVFSGIALLFERPIGIGDWVEIGDNVGKVIEITWRSVHLQTWSRDLLVIPNSELAKSNFKNLSRPSGIHVETFEVGFSYNDPPNRVKQILKQTALETEGVLSDPEPFIQTKAYNDFYINYKIGLFIADYGQSRRILDEYVTRIWYAAKRHNLTIPYPIQIEYEYESIAPIPEAQSGRIAAILGSIPSLTLITPVLVEQLNGKIMTHQYGTGEIVITQGDRLPGLYLVLQGRVELAISDRIGKKYPVLELSQGDFFGIQASLLSEQLSDVSVIALEDLEVLILDTETLQLLLMRIPRFALEIGELMESRRKLVQTAKRSIYNNSN